MVIFLFLQLRNRSRDEKYGYNKHKRDDFGWKDKILSQTGRDQPRGTCSRNLGYEAVCITV
jgi:hypothetical protein